MSSCRPTRRTRQRWSDKGLTDGAPVEFAGEQAHRHRPDRQPGRHHDPGRPRQGGREGHRGRRRGADHQVREPARRQPRQGARLPGRLRRDVPRQHRVQGGQREGRGRQARAGRGRRRRSSTSPTPRSSTKVATDRGARRRERRSRPTPGVVVKAPPNPDAAEAFLDLVRRAGRPGDPERLRVPPAVVPSRPASAGPCGHRRRRARRHRSAGANARSPRWPCCSRCSSACPS